MKWEPTKQSIATWAILASIGLCFAVGWERALLLIVQQTTLLVTFNWLTAVVIGGRTGDSAGAIKKLAEVTSLMNLMHQRPLVANT